jgi:hypothetical protein
VKKFKDKDTSYIINHSTPESAAIYLPFPLWDKLELDVGEGILIQHQEKLNNEKTQAIQVIKEVSMFTDRLTYMVGR